MDSADTVPAKEQLIGEIIESADCQGSAERAPRQEMLPVILLVFTALPRVLALAYEKKNKINS